MRAPGFWARDGVVSALLSPLGAVTRAATARRVARPGWRAPVPVLCCGNVTAGGAGKTTLALDLGRRLAARGVAVHFLTRGYGGREVGPLRVDPAAHDAARVGDEALLLAQVAPCWVATDRAAGARAAVAAGARALVMDDGLQNPTLAKDLSLLVIDGASGFGNGRLIPAGPLREPVAAGAARCRASVLVGADVVGALDALPAGMEVLRAALVPEGVEALAGRGVLAFAGIARPGKFFATLCEAGADLAATVSFPDHHRFAAGEVEALLRRAEALGAVPATTPKDAVRLPPALRALVHVAGVSLRWAEPDGVEALLDEALG